MANQPKVSKSGNHPFRGFLDVMSEMNRAQSQWMLHGNETGQGSRSHAAAYVPPADIFAIGTDLIVRCEIPGVRRGDVSATVSGGVLTISGHRDSELDSDKVVYYARERVYGAFRRSMILPEGIDQSAINASVRNGLLEITVKGGAAGKPQTIDIVDQNEE